MFSITVGEEAHKQTWQGDFPETTPCCRCSGEARIGFVAKEEDINEIETGPIGILNALLKQGTTLPMLMGIHPELDALIEKALRDEKPVNDKRVFQLHENVANNLWPHDAVAVAIYFCRECLETTSLYNQG